MQLCSYPSHVEADAFFRTASLRIPAGRFGRPFLRRPHGDRTSHLLRRVRQEAAGQ